MRILYLTSGFPYPLTSGYLRHYFFIRELARQHEITLLSLVNHRFRPEHAGALAPFTRDVLTFPSHPSSRRTASRLIRGLRVLTGGEVAARQMQDAVRRLVREREFDLAIFSGKHTLPALRPLRGLPMIADICDAASVRYHGRMRHSRLLTKLRCFAAAAYMRRAERKIIRAASHVLFASARDRDALVSPRDSRATVVPNGVDLGFWKRRNQARGRNAIVFTGAMHYPPNADAALFLIEQIYPRVRAVLPDAEVWIVGRDPGPRLIATGQRPGVTVTGFVDDVRPWLDRACVFAAPLRFGAGIQNKLLEALAMELPVVASPLAADGLRTGDGDEPPVIPTEGAGQTADRLAELLRASRQDARPHEHGRRFVAEHFDWTSSAAKLEGVMKTVTQPAAWPGDAPRGRSRPGQSAQLPVRTLGRPQ